MIINSITLYKKNNTNYFKVTLDENFFENDFVILHADILVKNGISSHSEITFEKLVDIHKQSEIMRASSMAMKLLASRLKTQKQLKDYLKLKKFDDDVIFLVIEKMIEYKILDDKHYAQSFISQKQSVKSKRYLQNSLMQKGVSAENINELLENYDDKESAFIATEKFLKNKDLDDKCIERLIRHLQYKGYNTNLIFQIVDTIKNKG